jgi:negative regulator of flagellin synthesis FlgM
MKIDNAGKPVTAYASQTKSAGRAAVQTSAATSQSAVSESVDLNPAASQMSEPPFDTSKVEAIKQAIASGQFRINPDAIAEGLINSARELAGS